MVLAPKSIISPAFCLPLLSTAPSSQFPSNVSQTQSSRPGFRSRQEAKAKFVCQASNPPLWILICTSITSFFGRPKPVPGSASAAKGPEPVKFDKEAWVAKLTDEQKELLKLEIDTLHESWLAQLKDDIVTKEFLDLKKFLKQEISSGKKVFPPMEDVYSWYVLLLS
jgi:hypothetical protein